MTKFLSNIRIADFLDIAIIAVLLYYVLVWIRRRASRSLVVSLAAVLSLYLVTHLLNMYMTSQVFQAGLAAALVALVLIFQEDIRMAAERMASWRAFRPKHRLVASSKTIDSLIESFSSMAGDKIGALVVVKGVEAIDRHLSGGISLNGRISTPLLYSIFHPETPSHDGAVIIEGDRIERFGTRLPLSHNLAEIGERGTRHSAALGLAERSDSLVIVVSEERGTISVAEGGKLERADAGSLRRRIENFYKRVFPEPTSSNRLEAIARNAGLKSASLGLAAVLWFLFAFRVEVLNRTFLVPVEYRKLPANVVIEDLKPTEARVSVSGLERAFNFDPSALVISLSADTIDEGLNSVLISEKDIELPPGIRVNQIVPRTLTVRAYRVVEKQVPIRVSTSGKLRTGMALGEVKPNPGELRILVRESQAGKYNEIVTEPLNLERVRQNSTIKARLLVPAGVRLANEKDGVVRVSVSVSNTAQ